MRHRLVVFLILLLILTSCSGDNDSVSGLQVQPYVRPDGTMGLSIYMMTSAAKDETMQMVVTDPEGNLSWSFNAEESKFDGKTYRGSSDISMPRGIMLPQGTWSVDVMFRDGTTITKSFEVSYDDDFDIPDTDSGPVFDSGSNLTFLP